MNVSSPEQTQALDFPEFISPELTRGDPAQRYLMSSSMDRSFKEYSQAFGFDLRRFKGQSLLDVGAGTHGLFTRQAIEAGIHAVALNPVWSNQSYISTGDTPEHWKSNDPRVAGLAENLPFQSDSFDVVLSLWGVPTYLPGTKDAYRHTFREIHRVMRLGGVALLYPVPAVTAAQAAFTEVLDEAVGAEDYKVLTESMPPKLIITKGQDDGSGALDSIIANANRMTPAFIW